MRYYISSIFFTIIFLDSIAFNYSSSRFNIESMCSKKIVVKTVIEIQIDYHWVTNQCSVTLVPHNESNLLRAFFVYYSNKRPASSCSQGAIYMYNAQEDSLLGDKGYCSSYAPRGYHTLGAKGNIYIKKRSYLTNFKVRIRIVEYLRKNETCPKGTFDCGPNDFCISQSLECESHRDCPSGLDEGDHCPRFPSYSAGHWVALVAVVAVCCCVCVTLINSRKPKHQYAWDANRGGGGPFDGEYARQFGTPQPVYTMSQVTPYGNPMPGNMVPNYNNPPAGYAQPNNVGPQTSYTGVLEPPISYPGVQGPQTANPGGVQYPYPTQSPNNLYTPQGYVIHPPMYTPPRYSYGGGMGYPQQNLGN